MAFPDKPDFNVPFNLDTRQAEQKLVELRARVLELRQLLAGASGKALADAVAPVNDGLKPLQQWGTLWASIAKNAASGGKSARTFVQAFQGGGLSKTVTSLAASAVDTFGQSLTKNLSGGKAGLSKTIGKTLTGALSGALRGFSVGGVGGALLGAAGGALVKGGSGGLLGFLGNAVGGLFGGLFGSGKAAREARKQQERLLKARQAMQQILSQTDQNDLNSLTQALNQVLRYKSGGGQAFQEKRNTALQLQQAITDRKAVIDRAIADFTRQNAALSAELSKFDDIPFDNLDIDYRNSLSDLQAARDQSLKEYQDSLEAQAQINAGYELKRQALLKQTSQDIIDTVIEEQNTINSLRAQTLVNEAKTSGSAVALINAQLQAQFVAIDNDIAAFKGAEEEKTAFLKAKATERMAAIKQANDNMAGLLQDGLDILNEGLVVGETKDQSQKKRLEKLFGTLNPLGLIQSDGSLVQSNLTVGNGAIQMNFEGIQDAQSLIRQLSDPIIQAKLLAALNTAIARS